MHIYIEININKKERAWDMTDIELNDLRRDYGGIVLDEKLLAKSPHTMFELWLEEAIKQDILDAQCFVLSTVSERGCPDSRIVLLKEIKNNNLVFYTNYSSQKGDQIASNQNVALNFYWAALSRQVRILGTCHKVPHDVSEKYFKTRPLESQISAVISHQSHEIKDRHVLETAYENFEKQLPTEIACPDNWGGYTIKPSYFEFFQGHPNRLHDRISYKFANKQWNQIRLAP